MKKVISIFLVLVLMFSFCACKNDGLKNNQSNGEQSSNVDSNVTSSGDNEETTSAEETTQPYVPTIKIGVLEPTEGYYKTEAQLEFLGILFANLKQSTIKIKKTEYKIELVFTYDVTSIASAKAAAKKLVSEGVNAVIGCASGEYALASVKIFSDANIPFINIATNLPRLTEESDNSFSLSDDDSFVGEKVALYIKNNLGAKKVLILTCLGDESSESMAFFCSQKLSFYDIEGTIRTFKGAKPDFESLAEEAKGYDAVFVPSSLSVAENAVNALSAKGVKNIISSTLWKGSDALELAKENNVKLALCSNFSYDSRNSICIDFMNWVGSSVDKSEITNGKESVMCYAGYDAYMLLCSALKNAKSTDGKKLISAIGKIEYEGLTGTISFDENGSRKQDAVMYEANSDSWKKVKIAK